MRAAVIDAQQYSVAAYSSTVRFKRQDCQATGQNRVRWNRMKSLANRRHEKAAGDESDEARHKYSA